MLAIALMGHKDIKFIAGRHGEEFEELVFASVGKQNIDTLFMGFTKSEAVKLFSNTYMTLCVSHFNELDTCAKMK